MWRGSGAVIARNPLIAGHYYNGDLSLLGYLADTIRAISPRILSVSSFTVLKSSASSKDKVSAVDEYKIFWGDLLSSLPNLTIVIAASNDSLTSYSALTSKSGSYPAELIAFYELRAAPATANRIVVVTSVSQSGSRSLFANDFAGLTDIAAPGDSVPVLEYSGNSYGSRLKGTSLSAPFVAGVLTLGLTMDPSLTPSQLKSLLLSGASARKGRNSSGTVINASTISGGSVYPVDAYAFLSLVSERSATLPLCGATVGFDWVGSNFVFRYNLTGAERLGPSMPTGFLNLDGFSVAPGGRRIAANGWDDPT